MAVTAEELRAAGLDPAFERLERTIANYRAGDADDVAVVSDPFAGREVLLDYAAQRFSDDDAERLSLSEVVDPANPPRLPDADVVIVDDCHYLFRREIGGFDALDRLIEEMIASDALYVTSWNRYAWEYLTTVKDVGRAFPTTVRIPELDADEIGELVAAYQDGDMPAFTSTSEEGRIKTLSVDWHPVRVVGSWRVRVPVVGPNPEWVSSWWVSGEDESIEAVVFEKVRRVSHGNPGVAATVWEQSVTNDEIAPAYVREVGEEFELDDDQAFLLAMVVTMERLSRDVLDEMAGDAPVPTALKPLVDREVVSVHGETVSITPRGLHPAVQKLRRRRLLW